MCAVSFADRAHVGGLVLPSHFSGGAKMTSSDKPFHHTSDECLLPLSRRDHPCHPSHPNLYLVSDCLPEARQSRPVRTTTKHESAPPEERQRHPSATGDMTMTNLVVAARELVILVDGVHELHRIVASQERFLLPAILIFYHLIIKPLAENREPIPYHDAHSRLLGV